jgi:multidrug efflux pump subunit AcrA (membrane-fusion protein)
MVIAAASFANPGGAFAADREEGSQAVDMVVSVVKARNTCFNDTIQVTGVIAPRSETLVRPEKEGLQISQVLVEPGDTVVSGQVLARLKPPEGQSGSNSTVQAPTAGLISSRTAVVGMMASPREPLFRIAVNEQMELVAETPIRNLSRLAPNQTAKVEILGLGEMTGRVRELSTSINEATQLGQIHLMLGRDSRLRVGAFGRATIQIAKRCGAAVPFSAVLYGPGGSVVQTVRDGRIETQRVTVGLFAGGQAEIREGLQEGDVVVERAGAFVRDGDRVRTIEPAVRRR